MSKKKKIAKAVLILISVLASAAKAAEAADAADKAGAFDLAPVVELDDE